MIRAAELIDIPELVELCREAWEKGEYPIPFDPNYTLHEVRKSIKSCFVRVSVIDDKIVGVISSTLNKVQGGIVAYNEMFYVKSGGEGLKLLMEYREWAEENANMVSMSISFGGDYERVGKLYETAGFKRVGGVYRL